LGADAQKGKEKDERKDGASAPKEAMQKRRAIYKEGVMGRVRNGGR
jgi:hypothetical protein